MCSLKPKEQLYWKRLGQLELLEEILRFIDKAVDKSEIIEKLRSLYVEVNEELCVIRREVDPVYASL